MSIPVQVIMARPDGADAIDITIEAGATVEQAIKASGFFSTHITPGDFAGRVGIYGKLVPASQVLRAGDRIEIYRELQVDPKAVRRKRAQKR
jgi:putative ubiquitin-RnfH superfamily antitoxin RatB of RatAB toxin-antitoxin module